MANRYYQLIKESYTRGDAVSLFETVLSLTDEIGLDQALSLLERCVIEKRLAWVERGLDVFERSGDPVFDGYRLFYETYLKVAVPQDGEIVAQTADKMVTRWWNSCPTLDACQQLGLDTREICHKVYCRPVQELLQKLDPRLRFGRNYAAIRPYAPYCEEIIYLED